MNCLLPNRCVEHVTSTIPARKLSDKDIHEIAATEGIVMEKMKYRETLHTLFLVLPCISGNVVVMFIGAET